MKECAEANEEEGPHGRDRDLHGADLRAADAQMIQTGKDGSFVAGCNAALKLNEKRDGMEGSLRRTGVPHRFRAWVGF